MDIGGENLVLLRRPCVSTAAQRWVARQEQTEAKRTDEGRRYQEGDCEKGKEILPSIF